MLIREYRPKDLQALRRMHAAQGFGYPFPDLENPLFLLKLVLEEDEPTAADEARGRELDDTAAPGDNLGSRKTSRESQITMAVLLRLTAEAYLLHHPTAGTPRSRWQSLLALHEAVRRAAAARGLDDVQAFLPPQVARSFGRRLDRLGWRRDPWTCFCKPVTSGE